MPTMSFTSLRVSLAGTLLALGMLAGSAHAQKPLPASKGAPQLGQKAPEFSLPDTSGKPVRLSDLLAAPIAPGAERSWLLLIFYRGFW